jgi:hypothetical protein
MCQGNASKVTESAIIAMQRRRELAENSTPRGHASRGLQEGVLTPKIVSTSRRCYAIFSHGLLFRSERGVRVDLDPTRADINKLKGTRL